MMTNLDVFTRERLQDKANRALRNQNRCRSHRRKKYWLEQYERLIERMTGRRPTWRPGSDFLASGSIYVPFIPLYVYKYQTKYERRWG